MNSFGPLTLKDVPSTAPGSSAADVLVAPVGGSADVLVASKLQQSLPSIASSQGILKHVHCLGKEVLNMSSPSSNALHLHPTKALSHRVSSASGLICSTNSFDSLSSEDFPTVAVDPTVAVVDPSRSGVGVHGPIGTVPGDPFAVDDPSGTGAVDDPIFDDPNAFATVATVPLGNSSVSLVRDFSSSALSPPCFGCEDSSPSSSPSSTPLLARRLNLIDEVEKKLGRPKKGKKKCGGSGKSSRKSPSAS